MRVAFYGRVSTDDAQDPSLSIPRQLGKCDEALAPIGERVTLTFWDVESGRKALEDRGNGKRDWTAEVDVPRAGGLPELLRSTQEGEVDAVIVESIDRLSRMTADGTRIERELEERDVALFAADEPLNSSATAILTRRVKQGVAEWYVRDLIERSRAGMEESVRQGWHTGGPAPYGYVLDPHPHPNPQKAREGRKKHRLIIDTVRGPIVLLIFTWYVEEALGLGTICERLNSDLDRYPPPKRNRKDENDLPQTWSKSQLHSLLRNPKYTGFNVWGRHDKRKGRPVMRPRDKWVWSATPTHEAIVPRDLFDAVEERAKRNDNSTRSPKPKHYPQRRAGRPGRLYVLRGRMRCGLCGRRMEGSHQKGSNWYRCQYVSRRGEAAADVADHPRVLGIKEDVVLDALRGFMSERLFGPERLKLLRGELANAAADGAWQERDSRLADLRAEGKKVEQALYRQSLRLEEHEDREHPVVKLATRRIEELSGQADAIAAEIAGLEAARPEEPRPEEIEALLADIPDLREALGQAEGEELIELLDAFDVAVSYDKPGRTLELSALLANDFVSSPDAKRPPDGRSRNSCIAGAGFEPATFGL
ncbi:MAG: recombinase family protein [Solirubrobacterales bacterium]